MDRKIFNLNLSVEATSAYILICNLAESGTPITIESARTFWNDSPEALVSALEELDRHRIIFEALDANQMRQYYLNPSDRWKKTVEC
jgi:phosphosulfolactate synthase (CoM biosynthesis protein A)